MLLELTNTVLRSLNFKQDFVLPAAIVIPSGERIHVTEILRFIPGQRVVFKAVQQNKTLVVKIFFNPRRYYKHYTRELSNHTRLSILPNLNIPCLAYSAVDHATKMAYLAYDWLYGKSLASLETSDAIKHLLPVIAQLHCSGNMQEDLHLANFLLVADAVPAVIEPPATGAAATDDGIYEVPIQQAPTAELAHDEPPHESVYCLDCATIVPLSYLKQRRNRQMMRNLALFFAQITTGKLTNTNILKWYEQYRAINTTATFIKLVKLLQMIEQALKKRLSSYKKKIMQTGTQVRKLTTKTHRIWLNDNIPYDQLLRQLMLEPDACLAKFGVNTLKQGNSNHVIVIQSGEEQYVVKYYRRFGLKQRMQVLCGMTHATRSWRNAHVLQVCGIKTAEPIACILPKFGRARCAYYVMRFIPNSEQLCNLVSKNLLTQEELFRIKNQIITLFHGMYRARILHNDLKWQNILYQNGEIFIVDLDAMRTYEKCRKFAHYHRKDVARFAAAIAEHGDVYDIWYNSVNNYLKQVHDSVA